jgi:hypothetical protein
MYENEFIPLLQKALDDVEDIQLQGHQIVISLSLHNPVLIASSIDSLIGPLERVINKKQAPKAGSEVDRSHETLKSTLRVLMAINQVDGVNRYVLSIFDQTSTEENTSIILLSLFLISMFFFHHE